MEQKSLRALAPERKFNPKNVRQVRTGRIIEWIQPKKGKPIPVYESQPVNFSRYPKAH